MCFQIAKRAIILLAVLAVLVGCDGMDSILPSTGTYRVNAMVNDISLDEFSFIPSGAKIQPFFEESVFNDPDVTGLMVYLKNAKGEVVGRKVIYTLEGYTYSTQENTSGKQDKQENTSNKQENTSSKQDDTSNKQEDTSNKQDNTSSKQDDTSNKQDNTSNKQENTSNKQENTSNNQDNNSNKNDEKLSEESKNSDKNKTDNAAADTAKDAQKTTQVINEADLIITVKNMNNLPSFQIPSNLPMGYYTLVSQVLSEDGILDKSEKPLFYLADAVFSFDNIIIHQPGIAVNPQLIFKNTVVMLEAILEFDSGFDPYIVWYNGKKIIAEGNYSSGAGNLLWGVPEQSGFFSLRAEAFPLANYQELAGYVKEISLPVSTKTPDMHLITEDDLNLLHWYIFEGNLNDSKEKTFEEQALKPKGKFSSKWMPIGGTYGLVTGLNDVYTLPKVSFSDNNAESWQILCRFKPLYKSEILNIQFGTVSNISMTLSADGNKLTLTLADNMASVSENITLPGIDAFVTVKINFSAQPDSLYAAFSAKRNSVINNEFTAKPIVLEAKDIVGYTITLGDRQDNSFSINNRSGTAAQNQAYSALWDELAVIIDTSFKPDIADLEDDDDAEVDAVKEELFDEEEQPESGSGFVPAA